jgi:hypothetical protein
VDISSFLSCLLCGFLWFIFIFYSDFDTPFTYFDQNYYTILHMYFSLLDNFFYNKYNIVLYDSWFLRNRFLAEENYNILPIIDSFQRYKAESNPYLKLWLQIHDSWFADQFVRGYFIIEFDGTREELKEVFGPLYDIETGLVGVKLYDEDRANNFVYVYPESQKDILTL